MLLLLALCFWGLFYTLKKEQAVANTILLCFTTIIVGFSVFSIVVIRSSVHTPTNEYQPDNPFTLCRYLSREQYGSTPLVYGQYFDADYDIEDVTFYFLGKGHLMSSYGIHYRSGIDYKDVQKALNVNYIPNGETQIQGYKCYQYVDSRYSKAVFLYPSAEPH